MFHYETDNPEFECRSGQQFSPFSKMTDLPEAHPASYLVSGECFLGSKAAGAWSWSLNLIQNQVY